jgi:hypothetical protein
VRNEASDVVLDRFAPKAEPASFVRGTVSCDSRDVGLSREWPPTVSTPALSVLPRGEDAVGDPPLLLERARRVELAPHLPGDALMLRGGLGPRNPASRRVEASDDGEATGAAGGARGGVAGCARAHEVEGALYPGPTALAERR